MSGHRNDFLFFPDFRAEVAVRCQENLELDDTVGAMTLLCREGKTW